MQFITEKLYYKDPYLKKCKAEVIDIKNNGIVLDKTVAYAEGGGQEGDRGKLIVDGKEIPFADTKKGPGRVIYLENFPTIQVDTPIYHFVSEEDTSLFSIGQQIEVEIDTMRRSKLSISHSGIHIVLMCLEKIFPGYESKIYGASIKENGARLDFRTTEKFTQEHIKTIEECVNKKIEASEEIQVFPHAEENEAWYWRLGETVYACGGTHIHNTKYIGSVKVKRKNLGKNGQRVSLIYETDNFYQGKYHE